MFITCPSKCASALAICACWGCWFFRHCNFVLPCDMSDALGISHMKSIEFSFLSGRKTPGLTAVQKCAYSINFVHLDLSMFRHLDHTLFVSCLSNPLIQLFLKTKRIAEPRYTNSGIISSSSSYLDPWYVFSSSWWSKVSARFSEAGHKLPEIFNCVCGDCCIICKEGLTDVIS